MDDGNDIIDQLKVDFKEFRSELRKVLENDQLRTWVEETYEVHEHGRVHEFGVWWYEGSQKFGYVFLARVGWKGVQPGEWGKIHQVINTPNWAIGPFEDIRVWDLNKIIMQEKPELRYGNNPRNEVIDEAIKAVKDWFAYENETIGRMPNARRADPVVVIPSVLEKLKR